MLAMAGQSDPHFNIFHAYRGSAPNDTTRRRQLEDNLTRALGITLSHLSGSPLAERFLETLGVEPQLRRQPFEVQFQVAALPMGRPSALKRRYWIWPSRLAR